MSDTMPVTDRVTVRLTAEQIALIQNLVDSGEFETVTDVVRAAVDEFMSKRFTPDNIRKVTVDLPTESAIRLESLVSDGDAVSFDDAIRNAVREYTRSRFTE